MKIDSLEALRKEKARLRMELEETEGQLKEDMKWIVTGLLPLKIISKSISKVMDFRNNGLVTEGIGTGLGMLIAKLLPRKSFWIARLILPGLIRRLTSNYIGDNKGEIMDSIKRMIQKYKSNGQKHNGMYDSSTAQEHY